MHNTAVLKPESDPQALVRVGHQSKSILLMAQLLPRDLLHHTTVAQVKKGFIMRKPEIASVISGNGMHLPAG